LDGGVGQKSPILLENDGEKVKKGSANALAVDFPGLSLACEGKTPEERGSLTFPGGGAPCNSPYRGGYPPFPTAG